MMTPTEVEATLRQHEGQRVGITFPDGSFQRVDVHSVDEDGFLHSGPDGIEPAHWWTRFESVIHVGPTRP